MALILSIDVGTTSTKAIVLDSDKGVVAEAERDTRLISPHAGWAEEDANLWWTNACELIRELAIGRPIAAVGVTGMVPCVVVLDKDGDPLRASIQQNDARAMDEIAELRATFDATRILARTGPRSRNSRSRPP